MLRIAAVLTMVITIASLGFSMNYIFGGGYSPGRSWVVTLGAMNAFNDELNLNIFTPASTSQSLIYDVTARIPLLGRNDKNDGYRLGPILEATVSSTVSFNVGIYGQYYIGPWRLEASISRPINLSDFSYSLGLWYFFSSGTYHFRDYLVADIKMDEHLPYFSIMFVEPF